MTTSVVNRPLIKFVCISAAIVGTIEAILWVVLSLVSIFFYHSVIAVDKNLSTLDYRYLLYDLFLNADNSSELVIVTPKVFNIFMYIYIASSCIWLFASLYMLCALTRDKWQNGYNFIVTWAVVTILISIFDLVVMSILVDDYIAVKDFLGAFSTGGTTTPITTVPTEITTISTEATTTSELTTVETTTYTEAETTLESVAENGYQVVKSLFNILATDGQSNEPTFDIVYQMIYMSYIFVFTLAARGYVLWIINVAFGLILLKFARSISNENARSLLPMIGGYSTGRPPWGNNLYEQTEISNNGYSNAAFTNDNDRTVFPRSDSFVTGEPDIRNQNPLSKGSNPYAQQIEKLRPVENNPNIVSPKLAKIGKQNGRRTPPRNVPPPNIPYSNDPYVPDPDYSPPGSPIKPKSALRPKSNYVL